MAFRSGVLSLKDTITKSVHSVLNGRGGIAATIQTFIVKVLIIAINMGTGVITARFLGPAGRGELTAMLVWPQLLAFTLTLGLPKSIIYNFKKHPEEKPRLFSAALIMSAGLGVLASMIGVGLIPYVLTKYPPEVIRSAQWLMVMSPLTLLGLICSSSLEAESDFTAANQLRYFVPLSTLALLGGLILTTSVTSFNAALAYTLPSIPITLWILVRLWRRYRPQWKKLGQSFQWLTNYGLRSYGIDLVGGISGQTSQALVVGLMSPTALGLYTVAMSVSRMLTMFEDSVITVLLPKSAARSLDEVIVLTRRSVGISTLLTATCAAIVMVLGPALLRLLYGNEFLGAIPVLRILLVEIVLQTTTGVLVQTFMATGKPEAIAGLQLLTLSFKALLMFLLIPQYQLIGAGLALVISSVLRLIFTIASYPLLLKVNPLKLILTREDWLFLLQTFKLIKRR